MLTKQLAKQKADYIQQLEAKLQKKINKSVNKNSAEYLAGKIDMCTEIENTSPVSTEDIPEFIGQIIDIFEDFLTDKQITIPNPEKEDNQDVENPDEQAILYGSDYGQLQTALEDMMHHWHITNKKED